MLATILAASLFVAGAPGRVFAAFGAIMLAGVIAMIRLEPYLLVRVTALFNPGADPSGAGYQGLHGSYALAGGGWWGVSLGASAEKWGFLPEAPTDFIFAVLGEELSLAGRLGVGLFALLTYAGFRVATDSTDQFIRFAAAAATSWLTVQALVNIGALIGLLTTIRHARSLRRVSTQTAARTVAATVTCPLGKLWPVPAATAANAAGGRGSPINTFTTDAPAGATPNSPRIRTAISQRPTGTTPRGQQPLPSTPPPAEPYCPTVARPLARSHGRSSNSPPSSGSSSRSPRDPGGRCSSLLTLTPPHRSTREKAAVGTGGLLAAGSGREPVSRRCGRSPRLRPG